MARAVGGEGGSGCRAPRVRVRGGPGSRGYAPRSSCGGAAPHRRPPGPSPAPARGSGSARALGGGKWRLLPAAAAAETPPERRAGGAGAGEPVRDGGRGGAGKGRGGEVAAAAHPRPARHEQVSPEAGASVRARGRVEGEEWPRKGVCARVE